MSTTPPADDDRQDANNRSFWMPGNYQRTVRRTEDAFQACGDLATCFLERARVERQYALQLSEWSTKWKPHVDSSPLYGSLLKAWQTFLSSTDRLASLHASVCRSLVAEDAEKLRSWQKDAFAKKIFGGFKEAQDAETGYARAQKPWTKRLKKLDKARRAYHKASRKEHAARERESQARANQNVAADKQTKIREDREAVQQETRKVRARYEKVLEETNRYAPRYMEEMEAIFEQSQEEERKRMVFLKEVFLSFNKHLDVTANDRVKEAYGHLRDTVAAIDEHEDLRRWKNTHGPGMPTDWPHFQEWTPETKSKKGEQVLEEDKAPLEKSAVIAAVRVRALYDYIGQETDELSFKAGEEFVKTEDEDDQGWCRGLKDGGLEGLYPANYVEVV
ncbi:protein kinase C and casein kinase II substrate protein 3 [Stigmatopora argus]